jgi:hypothetical protein
MLHSVQATSPVFGAMTASAAFGGYDADCMEQLSQGHEQRPQTFDRWRGHRAPPSFTTRTHRALFLRFS